MLTVEVTDASGAPAVGRVVEFEVIPVKSEPPLTGEYQRVLVAGPAGTTFSGQGSLVTDATGKVAARVRFGERVGEAIVRIQVPEVAAGAASRRATPFSPALGITWC
jgi:hypothetical protein